MATLPPVLMSAKLPPNSTSVCEMTVYGAAVSRIFSLPRPYDHSILRRCNITQSVIRVLRKSSGKLGRIAPHNRPKITAREHMLFSNFSSKYGA